MLSIAGSPEQYIESPEKARLSTNEPKELTREFFYRKLENQENS